MDTHHKVPRFLGGSEKDYNLEHLTLHEHFYKHLEIAEELDTFESWSSVTKFYGRMRVGNKLYLYINKRFGDVQRGVPRSKEDCKRMNVPKPNLRGKEKTDNHRLKQRQSSLGRIKSKETIERIRKSITGIKLQRGTYITPEGNFNTTRSAGKANSCSARTVSNRCKDINYFNNWDFIPN